MKFIKNLIKNTSVIALGIALLYLGLTLPIYIASESGLLYGFILFSVEIGIIVTLSED